MKKKSILTLILLLSLTTHLMAFSDKDKSEEKSKANEEVTTEASWEFYSAITQPTSKELTEEADYKFGREAGCLYSTFLKYYVTREEVVPGDPTRRTVIRKPVIYNAVRSIEKQLNKDLNKQVISKEAAGSEFSNILKIAISAFDSESKSFEDALQGSRKNPEQLRDVFKQVLLIEI